MQQQDATRRCVVFDVFVADHQWCFLASLKHLKHAEVGVLKPEPLADSVAQQMLWSISEKVQHGPTWSNTTYTAISCRHLRLRCAMCIHVSRLPCLSYLVFHDFLECAANMSEMCMRCACAAFPRISLSLWKVTQFRFAV